jgi:hypothetical protein
MIESRNFEDREWTLGKIFILVVRNIVSMDSITYSKKKIKLHCIYGLWHIVSCSFCSF